MFSQDLKTFLKSKSNWTGMTMIGSGIVGWYTKSMEPVTAFQTIMGGFGFLAIKDAIHKQS